MKRITFLVDGFNLYHSIRDVKKYTKANCKWLDISGLCKSLIHLFGTDAEFKEVYYFSAIPYHIQASSPNKISKHKKYIKCLEDSGVNVVLGRFKEKEVYCDKCKNYIIKHEEKETDVSIGVKLLELFHTNSTDVIVMVTGDTDLIPAVTTSKKLFPDKDICFCFPYNRKNKELEKVSTRTNSVISSSQYIKNQFPDPYILKSGIEMSKPPAW
jgi:uncharacterized LabA/DUF88 family protein